MSDTELGIGTAATVNIRGVKDNVAGIDIPGYRITATLGEGGMGTVYEAEQDAPRRKVAIKVLHARSGAALARFSAEADIMARLDHPGIARVLEAGDADGSPYLVMEYVDGKTLDKYGKNLPRRQRLELFVQLCDAVHHAHVNGVIHRDLKPANVMVTSAGRVVVLDFGVARLAARSSADTREGDLLGTPMYMSPEQASLRADQVDARTDVYTLGVILYELACGEFPYDVRELSVPAITAVVVDTVPMPLGKRDPELRGDLEAIAGKALEKEPPRRYQAVAALRDDIRRYLDGNPVSVRSPTAIERAARFVRRRPLLAFSVAAAFAASVSFTGVVTYLWRDATDAWRDATDARRDAEAAGARTETARGELEARTNELTLRTARAALARDPTEALAWLATLTDRDVDPEAAWAIADEALALGVARDVTRVHTDEVHWIEPIDGGFVTGGYDGRAIVWDPKPRVVFTAAHGRIHVVVPAPGSKELAIGGDSGALHVVGRDGQLLATLDGHAGDVQHVAWSSTGSWLATGDDHGNLYVWPKGRAPGRKLDTGAAAIGAVAFGGVGLLVAGDHDGSVWAWDVASGHRIATSTHSDVASVWTDGKKVAAVDATGTVWTWHVAGDALEVDAQVKTNVAVKRVVFAKDGSWVAIGGVGGAVIRVEGTKVEPVGMHRAQVRSLAISEDGTHIADGGEDGSLVVRDRATGRSQVLRGHSGRIRHVAFADGGRSLLSSDSDGTVRVWDLSAIATTLEADPDPIEHVAVSQDGKLLAGVDGGGKLSLWDTTTGVRTHVGDVPGRTVAIVIAGATPITGTTEGVVTWWTKEPVKRSIEGTVKAIAVGRDRVAVATSKGPIAMFALDGTPQPALPGHPGGTEVVAFDASGAVLASGGQDRVIKLWRDGAETAALSGPTGDTSFAMFSPAGDLLVTGGNDGAVRAWRMHAGVADPGPPQLVMQHTGALGALAVGNHWVVSAGRDAKLVRAKIDHGQIGSRETADLPTGAIRIALDNVGGVHAVMRTGAVARWSVGRPPFVAIDHGVRDAIGYRDGARWALAFDDGTLVESPLTMRSLVDLRALLARVTTVRLR